MKAHSLKDKDTSTSTHNRQAAQDSLVSQKNATEVDSFVKRIMAELDALHTEEKREVLPRFFKCGVGEYGEGDRFLGVVVPNVRSVARKNMFASLAEIEGLLESQWHEVRLCGLLILVGQCRKSVPKDVFEFYLAHTERINNWDLVDLTAPAIVGGYLLNRPQERERIYSLADSESLWEQRIAVVSTVMFIRNREYDDTYALAVKLMSHPHDLMHKAIGWMLREAGKRDQRRLEAFLDEYATSMPRTMLRYAIEKFPEELRRHYLLLM